mgnify:CR=1 FL=1
MNPFLLRVTPIAHIMRNMLSSAKKKKFGALIWSAIYLVLVFIFTCSASLIFHSTYYRSIFVSGGSMSPTLYGSNERANFGIIDTTSWAKGRIKRFDIVTTYFPWLVDGPGTGTFGGGDYSQESASSHDYSVADGRNPEYKIKRVIALEGESIFYFTNAAKRKDFPETLLNNIIILEQKDENQDGIDDGTGEVIAIYGNATKSVSFGGKTYEVEKLPFKRNSNNPTFDDPVYGRESLENPIAIPEGRYFAMGDNWATSGSTDCGTSKMPLYYDNIVGVLVAIEGICTISGTGTNKKCTNRHYSWPVIY